MEGNEYRSRIRILFIRRLQKRRGRKDGKSTSLIVDSRSYCHWKKLGMHLVEGKDVNKMDKTKRIIHSNS